MEIIYGPERRNPAEARFLCVFRSAVKQVRCAFAAWLVQCSHPCGVRSAKRGLLMDCSKVVLASSSPSHYY